MLCPARRQFRRCASGASTTLAAMAARSCVLLASGLALVISGTLLAMWLSGDAELVRIAAWRGKTNTCVGLTLGAIALLVSARARPATDRVANILSVAVGAIGGLTLFQYLAETDLGIDELIAQDWPFSESAVHPNRMAPNAAASFVLLGAVLILARRRRRLAEIGQVLALGLIALDGTALLGYLYDARFLYRAGDFIRISPYSATCFVLLAAGSLCLRPEVGIVNWLRGPGIGAYLARRLLLPVLIAPVALGWLNLLGHEREWWTLTSGGAVQVILFVAVFAALLVYLARSLDAIDARRKLSEQELRRAGELTAALAQAQTVGEVARVTVELGVPALGWLRRRRVRARAGGIAPALGGQRRLSRGDRASV